MAPYSSTLVWKIPWTEEPGRLQSMGSLRVRHDWATSISLFTFIKRLFSSSSLSAIRVVSSAYLRLLIFLPAVLIPACVNQGKLEMVKQEMARVNVDILGISELKWTGMGEFNSDDHYIYYCGQESLRRNGVAILVNKRVWMQYLDAISKTTEWSLFISKANHSISQ